MNWTESIVNDVANDLENEQSKAKFAAKFALGAIGTYGTVVAETAVNVAKTPLLIMKKLFNFIV